MSGDKPHHYIAGQWCNIGKDCVGAIQALVDNGANINALDNKGRTALHILAEEFSKPGTCALGQDFVESGAALLIQNNANKNLKYKGKTAGEIAESKDAPVKTQTAFGKPPPANTGGSSPGTSGSGGGGGSAGDEGDDGGDGAPIVIIIVAVVAVVLLCAGAAFFLTRKKAPRTSVSSASGMTPATAVTATPATQTGVIVAQPAQGGPAAAAKPAPMIIMAPTGS